MPTVLKTVVLKGTVGSNPTASSNIIGSYCRFESHRLFYYVELTERLKAMIRVCKIKDFQLVTASGAIWKVTILGDKETMGLKYAEAHIKPLLTS